MARTRTVYKTDQIAHLWARGDVSEARNPQSNFSFRTVDGPNGPARVLYSYAAPIAWIGNLADGARAVLICGARYSMTTSRHQALASRATWSGDRTWRVPSLRGVVSNPSRPDGAAMLEHYADDYLDACQRAAAAPVSTRDRHAAEAAAVDERASALARAMGIEWTPPAFDQRAYLADRKARALEKGKATRARKAALAVLAVRYRNAVAAYLEGLGALAAGVGPEGVRDLPANELEYYHRNGGAGIGGTLEDVARVNAARVVRDVVAVQIGDARTPALRARADVAGWIEIVRAAEHGGDRWPEDHARNRDAIAGRYERHARRALVDAWGDGVPVDRSAACELYDAAFLAELERDARRREIEARPLADRVALWRARSPLIGYVHGLERGTALLRLSADGSEVETSMGATFPASHAALLWRAIGHARAAGGREYTAADSRPRAGHFTVDRIDGEGNVRAGCHYVPFSECAALAAALGLTNEGATGAREV